MCNLIRFRKHSSGYKFFSKYAYYIKSKFDFKKSNVGQTMIQHFDCMGPWSIVPEEVYPFLPPFWRQCRSDDTRSPVHQWSCFRAARPGRETRRQRWRSHMDGRWLRLRIESHRTIYTRVYVTFLDDLLLWS